MGKEWSCQIGILLFLDDPYLKLNVTENVIQNGEFHQLDVKIHLINHAHLRDASDENTN